MRVMLTGAWGVVGRALREALRHEALFAFGHPALDITDAAQVARTMAEVQPEVVINAAAWTDVDGAERDPAAWRVNALAVGSLAAHAAAMDAVFIHFSTDYVFDGSSAVPYREDAEPCPVNLYGATKLRGDHAALACPKTYVLRLAAVYGPDGPSSMARLVDAVAGGEEVPVWLRPVSPTYAPDVALAVRQLLRYEPPFGVYHCTNGVTSWPELAREAARVLQLPPPRLRVVAPAGLAVRPAFHSALDGTKLAEAGIEMPPWTHALSRFIRAHALHTV